MLFKEVLTQAWDSLVAHRFRAGLTMLGIAWGILTVTSLMAYGNGFQRALFFGFSNAFSNGVAVIYGGQTSMQAGGERAGKRVYLKEADIEPLKQLGLVKYIDADGNIGNVCAGTNKGPTVQYYLDRPRNLGDLHGQAPVLWMASALLREAAAIPGPGHPRTTR